MPTYEYKCNACGHRWDLFQSMTAAPIKACPSCGKKKAERLIGVGAAVLFKGSGFYQTDYRSDSYKKAAEADTKPSTPAEASKGEGGKSAEAPPATSAPTEATIATSPSTTAKPSAPMVGAKDRRKKA